MLKDITLGQYFPGNSVVHRLDPRTKTAAADRLYRGPLCGGKLDFLCRDAHLPLHGHCHLEDP